MRTHELARFLLLLDDKEITCSVDVSKSEGSPGRRAFGEEHVGYIQDEQKVTLLFSGKTNYD